MIVPSRRAFIVRCGVAALSWFLLSCKTSKTERVVTSVDVGAVSDFAVGTQWVPLYRVAIKRDAKGLSAISTVCTHQLCVLKQSGNAFICPCHGSLFDGRGKVTKGPATKNLPYYKLSIEEKEQRLLLWHSEEVSENWRLKLT